MQIEYKNNRIAKICTNIYEAEKKHGKEMAEKIHLRIKQISAALSIDWFTLIGWFLKKRTKRLKLPILWR